MRAVLALAVLAAAALPAVASAEAQGKAQLAVINNTPGAVRCVLKSGARRMGDLNLDPYAAYTASFETNARLDLVCPKVQALPFGPLSPGVRYALIHHEGHMTLAIVTPDAPKAP